MKAETKILLGFSTFILLVFGIMASSFFVPVSADYTWLQKGNNFANINVFLIDSITDYDVITNPEKVADKRIYETEVVAEGHLPIALYYSGTILPNSISLSGSNLLKFLNKTNRAFVGDISRLQDVSFNFLNNISKTSSREICNPYEQDLGNSSIITIPNCSTEYYPDWEYKWQKISDLNSIILKKNQVYVVDIQGKIRTATKDKFSVDIEPKFSISGYDFSIPDYAWWNTSSLYKVLINISETNGTARTFEPINFWFNPTTNPINITKEIRVTQCDTENQTSCTSETLIDAVAWGATADQSANIVFLANISASSFREYYLYYNNSGLSEKSISGMDYYWASQNHDFFISVSGNNATYKYNIKDKGGVRNIGAESVTFNSSSMTPTAGQSTVQLQGSTGADYAKIINFSVIESSPLFTRINVTNHSNSIVIGGSWYYFIDFYYQNKFYEITQAQGDTSDYPDQSFCVNSATGWSNFDSMHTNQVVYGNISYGSTIIMSNNTNTTLAFANNYLSTNDVCLGRINPAWKARIYWTDNDESDTYNKRRNLHFKLLNPVTITIGSEESSNSAPQYLANATKLLSPQTYNTATTYGWQVNSSDADNNMNNALFQLGRPIGTLTNYTMLNDSSAGKEVWYYNLTQNALGQAGTYNYTFFLNDTSNAQNKSDTINYVVNKAVLSLTIASNGTQTYPYTSTTGAVETNSGDTDITYWLTRDDVLIDSTSPYTEAIELSAGTYAYKFNTSGTSYTNWTENSTGVSTTLTITKANPSSNLNIYLDGVSANKTVTYPTIVNATGNRTSFGGATDLTYNFYRDDVSIGSGVEVSEYQRLGNGTYIYRYNTTGGTNYTQGNATIRALQVLKGTSNVQVYIDNVSTNKSVTYNPTLSVEIRGNSTTTTMPPTFNLYISTFSQAGNPSTISNIFGVGSYQIFYNTSGNANWTAEENNTQLLTINKNTTNILRILLNGTDENKYIKNNTPVNITAISQPIERINITVNQSGFVMQTGINSVINVSNFYNTSSVIYLVNATTDSNNYTANTTTRYIYVDFDAPTWLSNTSSTTQAGQNSTFNITVNDNFQLSTCIFEYNSTNTTYSLSGASYYCNSTHTLPQSTGITFNYRWYFNDSAGNWNSTDLFNLTTTVPQTGGVLGGGKKDEPETNQTLTIVKAKAVAGNGICEEGEDTISTPEDCQPKADWLTNIYIGVFTLGILYFIIKKTGKPKSKKQKSAK